MPVITIHMLEGRDKEMKKRLIKAVSSSAAEALGIPMDRIDVIISDVPKGDWGKKGEPI
ncbi:MAG: tautomerase family protein [Nanoarchaeota archaeon]